MDQDDKALWNRKYAEAPEKWREPDPFLLYSYERFLSSEKAGSALDVAGGAGRNAIWLASRGWRVKIVDVSDVGLQLARENSVTALGLERADELIFVQETDLNHACDLGREQYDLVLVFRYLNRELFPALIEVVKPGGTLIYSGFTIAQKHFANGPHDDRFLLQPDELRRSFAALHLLHYEEISQDRALAQMVGRKVPSLTESIRS